MIQLLDALPKTTHKVVIHINNTNPILNPHSGPFAEMRARGIDVARDGMQFRV
jgi:pyrroloquinoline quinone biosynthesis protein B